MVLNAEYFLAMKVLLDEPGTPQLPKPQWPDALLTGKYLCDADRCAIPAWRTLSLWRHSGKPYFTCNHATGHVISSAQVQHEGVTVWKWVLEWDDGSGSMEENTLWLQVHDAQHFDLYDAQGRCNAYALLAEEELPERALWPQPLYMAVYQVEATDAALLPPSLHTLEILEYDDEPLMQCASIGMCAFQNTHWGEDGSFHATLVWSLRDDAGHVQPPEHIQWQIQDGDHFVWILPDGSHVRFVWSRDI